MMVFLLCDGWDSHPIPGLQADGVFGKARRSFCLQDFTTRLLFLIHSPV